MVISTESVCVACVHQELEQDGARLRQELEQLGACLRQDVDHSMVEREELRSM